MIGSQGVSPVAAPSSHPIALILQSSAGRGGVERVLIADDHPLVRDGLRTVISVAFDQADLFEASSVAEAVEIVDREGDFDLVLLDLAMPEMSGYEALAEFQIVEPDVKVVVITGMDPEHDQLSGILGVLVKPFQAQQISTMVEDVLAAYS